MLDWTRWNRGNLAKIHGSIPMHFRGRRKAYIPPIQHKQTKTRKATILHIGNRAREKWKFFLKIRDLSFSRTNYLIQFKLEKRAHGNNRQNCKRDSIESLVPRRRAMGHVRYEESVSSNDFRFGAHTSTIAFLVRPTCSASNSLIETACDYQITYTLHVLIYRRWKRGISTLISLSLMQT